MRRLHGIALSSLTALLLSSALTPTANAAPDVPSPPSSCPIDGDVLLNGTSITTDGHVQQAYFKGDNRLGPEFLPNKGQVGELLAHYQRFMAMGPKNLLDCYWKVDVIPPGGTKVVTGWKYPPNHGFVTEPKEGTPVPVGTKLQLFGNPGSGEFLAPAGTLYEQSAIPPSNLDTFTNDFPFNYHVFSVCKVFHAEEGQTAPWFQQPGGGKQDWIGNGKISEKTSTGELVSNGYLVDITTNSSKPCPS